LLEKKIRPKPGNPEKMPTGMQKATETSFFVHIFAWVNNRIDMKKSAKTALLANHTYSIHIHTVLFNIRAVKKILIYIVQINLKTCTFFLEIIRYVIKTGQRSIFEA
jgi:hypothetical protein